MVLVWQKNRRMRIRIKMGPLDVAFQTREDLEPSSTKTGQWTWTESQ